jgi:methionyl aminopeptidase
MIDYPFKPQKNKSGKKFGAASCVSINDTVAHCKPNRKKFKQGDIVSIDCGWRLGSLMYDAAFTVSYNTKEELPWVTAPLRTLIDIKEKIRIANTSTDISQIIEYNAKVQNLDIVTALAGHGIGHELHEPPIIHNAMGNFSPVELFDGLVFCIEPIYTPSMGETKQATVYIDSDGWSIKTIKKEPTTHWETMFCIEKENPKLVDLVGLSKWEI